MSRFVDYKDRQVVPRLIPLMTASFLGDLTPIEINSKPKLYSPTRHEVKKIEWEFYKELPYAIELISSALAIKDYESSEVKNASKFILKNSESNKYIIEIAEKILNINAKKNEINLIDIVDDNEIIGKISYIKNILIDGNNNPIRWAELAYYYILVNENEKAVQSIKIALALGPNNRYILRTATRIFIHLNDGQEALSYLRKSNLIKVDPWIMASEIAVSDLLEKGTKLKKSQLKIIHSESINPQHLSEIRSSLGTLEAKSGAIRNAKKIINLSLNSPNENTLAQAKWLYKDIIGGEIKLSNINVLANYESKARISLEENRFEDAIADAKNWYNFQPFSTTPITMASYLSSIVLIDHDSAIEILLKGKKYSPDDILINNNLAYSYAALGKIEEAEVVLNEIKFNKLEKGDSSTISATLGLIEFKKNNIEKGRELYKLAENKMKEGGFNHSLAIAYLCWGREELRIGNEEEANLHFEKSKIIAEKLKMSEIKIAIENNNSIYKKLKNIGKQITNWSVSGQKSLK